MKILYYQKWRCFMCMVALKRHSTQTLLHVKQEIALQDAIAVGLAVPEGLAVPVVPEGLESSALSHFYDRKNNRPTLGK